jgi:hypothetical protein
MRAAQDLGCFNHGVMVAGQWALSLYLVQAAGHRVGMVSRWPTSRSPGSDPMALRLAA